MTSSNGSYPDIEFNSISEEMLETYEEQLFDVQKVRGGGAHRYVNANVQAAWDAGWLVNEPCKDFASGEWKKTEPSAERYDYFSEIVVAVDEKYGGYTIVSPNG